MGYTFVITLDRETGDVIVRSNEVLVSKRRLVFQLACEEHIAALTESCRFLIGLCRKSGEAEPVLILDRQKQGVIFGKQ